jgi:acetate kinase
VLAVTRNAESEITGPGSKVRIYVIPTDEELVMTEDTYALIQGTYDIHTKFSYSFQSRSYINKAREEMLKVELAEKKGLAEVVAHPR